jgi:hypothetical protein
VFFTPSQRSQAAGRAYLKRFRLRTKDRDPEVSDKVAPAQIEALAKWGAPRENPYDYLEALQQPTLVVNGLLNQTARSGAPTEAGECPLLRLGRALRDFPAALEEVATFGEFQDRCATAAADCQTGVPQPLSGYI